MDTSYTEELFLEDAYLRSCTARVMAILSPAEADSATTFAASSDVAEGLGIVLDRTVFYPMGGGQPGDSGALRGKASIEVMTTRKHAVHGIVHWVAANSMWTVGDEVVAELDWEVRHRHMRFHSALHLLCGILPFDVTGGQISTDKARLDFDASAGEVPSKDALTAQLQALVAQGIDAKVLQTRGDVSELVRTRGVAPPKSADAGSAGVTRVVAFGDVDRQPCGGTHVRNTAEIGTVVVRKLENKGKHNRRVVLVLD